jgi:2,4-dienoyl-CoA reductase-like NADH-dependent reductase (Old Yellow Enzyme family)
MRPGSLKTPQQEVYYRKAARLYKQGVTIPLILAGGIRSYGVAKKLVGDGKADYISMSRPLICEPGLVKRWRKGDAAKRIVFQTMRALHLHWTVGAFTA